MSQLSNQPLSIKTKPLFMYKKNAAVQGNQQRNMETTTSTITITITTRSVGSEKAGWGKSVQKAYNRFI